MSDPKDPSQPEPAKDGDPSSRSVKISPRRNPRPERPDGTDKAEAGHEGAGGGGGEAPGGAEGGGPAKSRSQLAQSDEPERKPFRYATVGTLRSGRPSRRSRTRARRRWALLGGVIVLLVAGGLFVLSQLTPPARPPGGFPPRDGEAEGRVTDGGQAGTGSARPASPMDTVTLFNQEISLVDGEEGTAAAGEGDGLAAPAGDGEPVDADFDPSAFREDCLAWFAEREEPGGIEALGELVAGFTGFVRERGPLPSVAYFMAIEMLLDRHAGNPERSRVVMAGVAPLFEAAQGAIRSGREAAVLHYLRGLGLSMSGELTAAVEEFHVALNIAPDFEQAARSLYSLHGMRGDTDEQIETGRQLLSIAPDDAALIADLARLLVVSEREDDALALLEERAGVVERHPFLEIYRAQVMSRAGVPVDRLLAEFQPVMARHPDDPSVAVFHLLMLDQAGRPEQVTERLPALLERVDELADADAPQTDRYALILASLAWKHGEQDASERIYRELVDADGPISPVAANDLAYKLAKEDGHLEEAERLATMALEARPDQLSFIDTMATIRMRQGRPGEAVALFERNFRIEEMTNPLAMDTLAEALEMVGRDEEAATLRKRIQESGSRPE